MLRKIIESIKIIQKINYKYGRCDSIFHGMPVLMSFSFTWVNMISTLVVSCFPHSHTHCYFVPGSCPAFPQLAAVVEPLLERREVKWLVEYHLSCSCWWRRNLSHPHFLNMVPRSPSSALFYSRVGLLAISLFFKGISSHCIKSGIWARSETCSCICRCCSFFPFHLNVAAG